MPSLNSAYSDSPRTKQEFSGMDASVEVSEPLRPAAEPEPEPAGADASAIVVARADEQRAKEALEDGCCAGAAPFLLIAAVWCGLLAIGVVGLVADTGSSEPEPEPEPGAAQPDGLRIAGIASLAAAVLLLLYGIGPFVVGLCRDGPPPGPHGPFQAPARTEENKVSVRKVVLFYNPVSGVDPAKNVERAERVRSRLRAANVEVDMRETPNPTTPPYDTTADVIRDLDAEGLDGIAIIGGDGSFAEAVNGMLARPGGEQHIPLAHIACGSANSVLTDTKAEENPYKNYDQEQRERDIDAAVDAIVAGYAPFVDVNKVVYGPDASSPTDYMYSINVVGWAADQCMGAVNIEGIWRKLLGSGRYFWRTAGGLCYAQPPLTVTSLPPPEPAPQLTSPRPSPSTDRCEASAPDQPPPITQFTVPAGGESAGLSPTIASSKHPPTHQRAGGSTPEPSRLPPMPMPPRHA
eukprot:COSAG04_NODE_4493_length_2055_cov_1.668200_1_plen_463_part_10